MVTFFPAGEVTRWIFLLIVVGWSISMAVFRSPAIALLGKYAGSSDLPLAASLLTLAGGLIAAFRPISTNFILSLGAVFTFAFASFVLLAAAFMLRSVNPPEKPVIQVTEIPQISEQLPKALCLLIITGCSIAWGSRLLMDVVAKLLKVELQTNNIDGMMFIISLALAFAALPAGAFATKIGNRKAIIGGSLTISILMLFMLFFGAKLIFIFLTVMTFSVILNGVIPLAISLVSSKHTGLAIGMYFAGVALGGALLTVIFPQLATIAPMVEIFVGAVAFLAAGICVATSHRIT
jgi:hypothetical protein